MTKARQCICLTIFVAVASMSIQVSADGLKDDDLELFSSLIERSGYSVNTVDADIGQIHYYSMEGQASEQKLLLVIQGSGCESLWNVHDNEAQFGMELAIGASLSHNYSSVVLVEKPDVQPGFSTATPGSQAGCSDTFKAQFSGDNWAIAMKAVLEAVHKREDAPLRLDVIGISEGAAAALLLAQNLEGNALEIDNYVSISGVTRPQIGDFILNELHATETERSDGQAIQSIIQAWSEIGANPDKEFRGHANRRWDDLGRVNISSLVESHPKARVSFLHGRTDSSVPIESAVYSYASVLESAAPRPNFYLFADSGHNLAADGCFDQVLRTLTSIVSAVLDDEQTESFVKLDCE